ncbi:hypothetical protein IFJ75_16555 [Brevundimonas goettingensis]|uniref:Uncharacterized protein n=1 Tax=Brevundimonas goettingensis TaxID=2774190 RepID=A0A975H067_9CAUL|nr:hypothetical protein IFJ75_16555 [Brevundimonas goettingensis]
MGKGLVKKLVAGLAAAASAFVAVIALGATLFYALCLVLPALGAAAITFAVFAAVTALIAVIFLNAGGDHHHDDDEDEPESFAQKAVHLLRERPILGAAGGLGILFFLLRNPALAAIAASMITEKRMESRGYGRRRR